jgi:hypothetical protein
MVAELLLGWLRRHDRQIVDVDMAGQAAREFIMERLFVRLAMTVGTLRDKAVFVPVAGYAGDRSVLAAALRQFV